MMKCTAELQDWAPLRTLDDFLLGSAKFQVPNYKDLEKWGYRVAQNLLYYQTNYFLMFFGTLLLVAVLHPMKMLTGGLSIGVMYTLFYFVNLTKFRRDRPFSAIIVMVFGAGVIIYIFGSLLIFLLGILLPMTVIFLHASLRLRNVKNKLSNIERAILNKTPMGVFLESFNGEPDLLS